MIFDQSGWRCYYCWCDLSKLGRDATIDHLLQYYRGGSDEIENLVSCCRRCNSARGSLTPMEFSKKRYEERKKRMQELGKKGGDKTAEKGHEYFSQISKKII